MKKHAPQVAAADEQKGLMVSATEIQQQRLRKGLCPLCGTEAAPYRLCGKCRYVALVRRVANRLHEQGYASKEKRGQANWYAKAGPPIPEEEILYREAQPGDRRRRPRVKHVPVDIEETLRHLFQQPGIATLSEEEIVQAWGKLRVRPGRRSAAHDLATLILAERRRLARGRKRERTQ